MCKFRDFDKYEIYEDGRIWSYSRNKFLKPRTLPNGYQRVELSDNEGKIKDYYIHRVVYEAVSGNPILEGMQVNHISEDKMDNAFSNLNLMTPKDNTNWGTGIERATKARSKQVGAYKNDELVMTFQSSMEARRQGFNQGAVSACCRGERKTYKGYTWKYI